jgi:hypothetical protein
MAPFVWCRVLVRPKCEFVKLVASAMIDPLTNLLTVCLTDLDLFIEMNIFLVIFDYFCIKRQILRQLLK